MAYTVKRGSVWWVRIKLDGKWRGFATSHRTDDPSGERKAKHWATDQQRKIEDQGRRDAPAGELVQAGPMTVSAWARAFIARRREINATDGRQFRDWRTDEGRLANHVLPRIGNMRLDAVRPADLALFVHDLRTNPSVRLG